jgi:tetratricopeptide (TPR) repeat protein
VNVAFAPLVLEVETDATIECLESEQSEKKDDPGYASYKKGYDFVLEEEWEKAIKQFTEMMKTYPKSNYYDDAMYWSAYSYKHTDEDKARELYKQFMKKYPDSKYYDDAVADMDAMDVSFVFTTSDDSNVAVVKTIPGKGFTYGVGTTYNIAKQQMRTSERMLQRQLNRLYTPQPSAITVTGALAPVHSWEKLDKETQLRMDALNALGERKDDEMSYNALKTIATDSKQHRQLRVAAMELLLDFKKHDPLPVLLEVARKDTSQEIQNRAIDYIGMISGNKNRSVETLGELFSVIPKYRTEQLMTILSSVAEIGNEKAVVFLSDVARTNENYDLRRDAVYYLGSIGSDKAREALFEIMTGKKER